MTRAKDISKILTDADLSGTLDVTGAVTAGSVAISDDNNYSFGDGTTYIQGSGAADRLKFITNASEAMRIDSSGNVGIGTSIPDEKLDVRGTLQVGVDGTTAGLIRFMDSGSVTEEATISSDANGGLIFGGNSGPGELIFRTGSSTERMRIHSGGQLSLATTDATHGFNVGQSGTDFRGRFQGNNQYRLGLQNGTSNLVWLGSGGADNFRISNSAGSTIFEIDSSGVVKNTDFIIPFPAGSAPNGSFTHYNNGSQQSTDASHQNLPVSCNLTVKAIYLYVNGALSSGSATVNLQKNGSTSATINVTTGTNAFNSTGLSISFSAGDRMGIKIIGTSTSAAWYNVSVLCERA